MLADLASTIRARSKIPPRAAIPRPVQEGITRIAQKVGEEAVETALAATTRSPTLPDEAADLLYHLLVLLEATDTGLDAVMKVLAQRAKGKK